MGREEVCERLGMFRLHNMLQQHTNNYIQSLATIIIIICFQFGVLCMCHILDQIDNVVTKY